MSKSDKLTVENNSIKELSANDIANCLKPFLTTEMNALKSTIGKLNPSNMSIDLGLVLSKTIPDLMTNILTKVETGNNSISSVADILENYGFSSSSNCLDVPSTLQGLALYSQSLNMVPHLPQVETSALIQNLKQSQVLQNSQSLTKDKLQNFNNQYTM